MVGHRKMLGLLLATAILGKRKRKEMVRIITTVCLVGNCKMVVKRLPQHLQTKHKMKPSENYYNVLKQAEKYFDWDIVGSSPKKTISLPVTCSKEQETTSKFTVSLNPCKTPLEPKTPSKMAISISSCKTPVELKKQRLCL